jgi:hypothetical protein
MLSLEGGTILRLNRLYINVHGPFADAWFFKAKRDMIGTDIP